MTVPAQLRSRNRLASRGDRLAAAAVWIGTAVFAALHSALIVGRFHRFGVYTFDFGIFDQGLWLLSRFQDPFVTLRGLNLFADHSSYIMVFLTPLYWIWADPRVLLVTTVVVLSVSAPLLFAIGRRLGVRPTLAAAVALAFLAHPAMRWATWDNFHPELLVMPLLLGALLLILNEQPWWAFGLVLIALTAKEDVALIVVPFGLWVAWRYHRTAGLAMAATAVGAIALNFLVLLPAFSPTGDVLYTGRYTEYGTSAIGIIGGVASSPGSVLGDITRADSLSYLRDMVLTAPTSLAAPLVLLIGLPITMANALSTHFYQIDIRYHYTIYLLTVVGIAALFGARWLQARASRTAYGWIVAAVVLVAVLGLPSGPDRGSWGGTEDATAIEDAIDQIGPGDIVSANSTLAVHLAHRTTVYRFPNPFRELDYGTPGIDYDPGAEAVEWILLEPSRLGNFSYAPDTLARLLADRINPWETVISTDEVLLLRRR